MRLAAAVILCFAAALAWPARFADPVPGAGGRRISPFERFSHWARSQPVVIGAWSRLRAGPQRRRRRLALVALLDALAAGLDAGLSAEVAVRESVRGVDDPVLRAAFVAAIGDHDLDRRGAGSILGQDGKPTDAAGGAEASAPSGFAGNDDGLALLARAWRLSHRLGTPLSESVRAVAVLLRAEIADADAVTVAMSEARATVVVLMALPFFGPLFAACVGIPPAALYGAPAAAGSGVLGLLCLGLGGWWMRRLLRGVARAGESS